VPRKRLASSHRHRFATAALTGCEIRSPSFLSLYQWEFEPKAALNSSSGHPVSSMPSISPSPGSGPTRRGPAHKLSNPSLSAAQTTLSTASALPSTSSAASAPGQPGAPFVPFKEKEIKESEADARLRDRGIDPETWPSKVAFGGKRRVGGSTGKLRRREWIVLGVICLVGAGVRLWRLWQPSSVV
jgi:hypothetical protein